MSLSIALPDGRPLADALLAQDHSPRADELRDAWARLGEKVKPIAVVFDVGAGARDQEHVHAVIVRHVQQRLGYSKTSQAVADYELKLEIDGLDAAFRDKVLELKKKPWGELKDKQLVEDEFSLIVSKLRPDLFPDETTWMDRHVGKADSGKRSADEAAVAIQHMLDKRFPGRTLFLVVDEVSQYVHDDDERMLALQSFVSAIGQRLKGRVWLLATGQQKLEDGSGGGTAIPKLKDRFPPSLRVHLSPANIRDVVHKRLLRKKQVAESELRAAFAKHRADLALYAYEAREAETSETSFIETYPLLPKHVELLLDITTGLRSRSSRTQGDAFAIRGLLQLLGDLFREHGLANREVGAIVSIDLIYDVLASALGADVQLTIGRALEHAKKRGDRMMERVVKAVTMLELLDQEKTPTTAELVSRCLYQRLGQGNELPLVEAALGALVGHGFVAHSEKTGYKIESAAGQEWQRERDQYEPTGEQVSASVRERLATSMADVTKLKLDDLELPWLALYSDGLVSKDVRIKDDRRPTVLTVDLQFTSSKGDGAEGWVPKSDTAAYRDRFIWVVGDVIEVKALARRLFQSKRIVDKYDTGQSLGDEKRRLLMDERNRMDRLGRELADLVKEAFLDGRLYFRGTEKKPRDLGATFQRVLDVQGAAVVRAIYPHPMTFAVTEAELKFLLESELSAPPPVFGQDKLGILQQDAGRWDVVNNGRLPTDVLAFIRTHGGVEGGTLLQHFGGPPHGVAPDLVRAAVIGLLRGSKLRVHIPGVGELTSVKDEGARELLKEGGLRKAQLSENLTEVLSIRDRTAICNLLKGAFQIDVARENEAIADAVQSKFSLARTWLNEVGERFRRLPKSIAYPPVLTKLEASLENCRRSRKVEQTLQDVKSHLPALGDGLTVLRRVRTDLTDTMIQSLRDAEDTVQHYAAGLDTEDAEAAFARIKDQLTTDRPWERAAHVAADIEMVRAAYRAKRKSVLDAHAGRVEQRIQELKRRDGFDRLDPDQSHQVLRHLHGSAATTDEKAIAPSLEALPNLLRERLDAGYAKSSAELAAILEGMGQSPVIEIDLDVRGREVRSEEELDRLLADLRRRILHELSANHHVRIK